MMRDSGAVQGAQGGEQCGCAPDARRAIGAAAIGVVAAGRGRDEHQRFAGHLAE
jgi:hypothetical protein